MAPARRLVLEPRLRPAALLSLISHGPRQGSESVGISMKPTGKPDDYSPQKTVPCDRHCTYLRVIGGVPRSDIWKRDMQVYCLYRLEKRFLNANTRNGVNGVGGGGRVRKDKACSDPGARRIERLK